MKKPDKERRVVKVIVVKNPSGTWDVLTYPLLNTVGTTLGPSTNLTHPAASQLAKAWIDRQNGQDSHEKAVKTTTQRSNFKQWDQS